MATYTTQDGTATYTLDAGDANTVVGMSHTSPITVTVNSSIFSAGDTVHLVQTGTAQISMNGTATLRLPNGDEATREQYSAVMLLFISASEAIVYGDTSTQDAAITSGTITGITDLAIADGGTGASTAADARTNLDVDQAGTDNSTNVTLAGTPDYITISGQEITRNQIDLTTDVTGDLPITEGGTGASDAATARTNLGAGTGNLDNLVEDTTPQLGGDLDLNGFNIDFPTTLNISDVLDEDDMASDSATVLATQQSIKAYVDTTVGNTSALLLDVYNNTGGTLTKGSPVYISGYNVGQDLMEVTNADSDSSATMPAVGLVSADILTGNAGQVVVGGEITGVATNTYSVGDALYVSGTAGQLTSTKPVGAALIQKVGTVTRSHATLGNITVVGAGRSNDVPNFTAADRFWYGGASGVTTEGTISLAGRNLIDDADASAQRTTLGVDPAGTDNSTNVTLAGTPDYITITGQEITRNLIDLTTDVTGDLPVAAGGTGASDAPTARTNLGAGTLNNVSEDSSPSLGGPLDVSGQEIVGAIDLHSTGDVTVELGDAAGTNKVSVLDSGAVEVAAIDSDGNITTSGTVDGRDVAADGTKLDGIEASADVTDAANVETAIEAITFSSVAGATGDEVMIVDATDGGLKAVLWENLPGAGGGISAVVEDTAPSLGGQLDVNGQAIGDGTLELVTFTETVSAVNHVNVTNAATGNAPEIEGAGDDATVGLTLGTKGAATLDLQTSATSRLDITDSGVRLGAANARVTTVLDEDTMTSDSATALATQQSIKAYVDTATPAASDSTAGVVELATAAETTTGTDATRAVTPDGLAGSEFGERGVQITCVDYTTNVATGDGQGYFHIDSRLAGMDLVDVHAEHITNASSSGTTTIQVRNVTQAGVNMLSTALTIDFGETGSDTAATGYTIDTANDDVAENDRIAIDVDAIPTGTAPQGLIVTLGFRLP